MRPRKKRLRIYSLHISLQLNIHNIILFLVVIVVIKSYAAKHHTAMSGPPTNLAYRIDY